MKTQFSRRQFLKLSASAGGGMMLAIHLPVLAADQKPVPDPWLFVDIARTGIATIGARGTEIGQGVKTSLPMLIAEELDVAWSHVKVVQLPYIAVAGEKGHTAKYGRQGAGGSTSVSGSYKELRSVGAVARQLLIEAAAQRWSVNHDQLSTKNGRVLHQDGRSLGYGQLTTEAAKLSLPNVMPALKSSDQFTIIGQPTLTVDTQDIVSGRGYYGIDAKLPGALVAVVARCPYFEGDVKSFNADKAKAVEGVRHVVRLPAINIDDGTLSNMAAGIAVVATDTWSAIKGRQALEIEWQKGKWANDSTSELSKRAHKAIQSEGHVTRADGDIARLKEADMKSVSANYSVPFLAHSTLEPQNALIDIKHNHVTVIASTQQPARVSSMVSKLTGIDRENIDIEMPRSGGGFGRRLEVDYIAEAVLIAQATGAAIKLQWTRDDDLQNDYYRPFGLHQFDAYLDDKEVVGWSHKIASTGKRYMQPNFAKAPAWMAVQEPDQFPAGCIDNFNAEFMQLEFGLLCGWWRAPAPTFLAFPVQSFIDEVAAATKRDPLELRISMLGESRDLPYNDHGGPTFNTGRLAAVTKKVADLIDYKADLPKGHGIGIASHFVFGGYVAHAMEVSVVEGKPVIHRCHAVVDIGQVVNPLGVEAQMIGGTIDGISTALKLEVSVKDGKIEQTNFPNYPHLKMADAPDVAVHIMTTDHPPAGAGEMGIPTAAPALCNAIFAATGKRIRNLPIANQLA